MGGEKRMKNADQVYIRATKLTKNKKRSKKEKEMIKLNRTENPKKRMDQIKTNQDTTEMIIMNER